MSVSAGRSLNLAKSATIQYRKIFLFNRDEGDARDKIKDQDSFGK